MATVHHLSRGNVEHTCRVGHTIPKGEPYSWAAPGYRGVKMYACGRHPFRPSELTTGLRAGALAAQETLADELDSLVASRPDALDVLEAAVLEFVDAVTDYAAEREAALSAWPNGNSQLEELWEVAEYAMVTAQGFMIAEWPGDTEARDRAIDGSEASDDLEAWADWEAHVCDQIEAARELCELDL